MSERKIGSQTPTLTRKNEDPSQYSIYNSIIDDFLKRIGITLFPWQAKILDEWLCMDSPDHWAHKNIGLSVPRRNGKSELLIALILVKVCLFKEKVIYSSYHTNSMEAVFTQVTQYITRRNQYGQELRKYFELAKDKNNKYVGPGILTRANGKTIVGKNGGNCVFITRGGGNGRGLGADSLILDESQELSIRDMADYTPIADGPNSQIFYVGTPQPISSTKTEFASVRKQMLDGMFTLYCWHEWAAPRVVKKKMKKYWYMCNPSMGLISTGRGGLSEDYIEQKFVLSDEQFAVEILGYWTTQDQQTIMDVNRWMSLEVNEEPEASDSEKIALAVKFSLDGEKYAVALSSKDINRKTYVSILSSGNTIGPVEDLVDDEQSIYISWQDYFSQVIIPIIKSRKCVSLTVDGSAHISELQILLSQYRLWDTSKTTLKQKKIKFCTATDIISANAFFMEKFKAEELCHSGDEELEREVMDAGKRAIRPSAPDSGFGFRSISGQVDMSCLEASAMSIYGVEMFAPQTVRKIDDNTTMPNSIFGSQNSNFKMSRRAL